MDVNTEAGVVLTDKEIAFCHYYVSHWNGTRAALEAGYPQASSRNQAKDMLKKEHIQAYLKFLKSKVEELSDVCFLRNAQVLKRIAYSKKQGVKDRIKAIETLNKMFGYNSPDKVEHSGQVNIPPIKWVE